MNSSLTNGLVVVICRIGQHGHRTSLPLDFHVWGYMKNMVSECKVNRREELYKIFDAERHMNDPDVPLKVQIIPNLKCP
jgi:hypothetical protein